MQTNKFTPFFTYFPYEENDLNNLIKTITELGRATTDKAFYEEIVNTFLAAGRDSYASFVEANTSLAVYSLPADHREDKILTLTLTTLNTYALIENDLFVEFVGGKHFYLNTSAGNPKFLLNDYKNARDFLTNINNLTSLFGLEMLDEDTILAGPKNVWSYLNAKNILTYEDTKKHSRDYRKHLNSSAALTKYYSQKHPGKIVRKEEYENAYNHHNIVYFEKNSQLSLGLSFASLLIISVFFILASLLSASVPFFTSPWLIYIFALLALPFFLNIELKGKIIINLLFAALYGVGIAFNYITITNYSLFLIAPFTLYFINSFFLVDLKRIWPLTVFNFVIGLSAIYLGYTNAQLFLFLIGGLICGSFVMGIAPNTLRTTYIVHMSTLVGLTLIYSLLYYFDLLPVAYSVPLSFVILLTSLVIYTIANIMYKHTFKPTTKIERIRFFRHFFTILALLVIFGFLANLKGVRVLW